jgi:hypothetical protein
MAVRQVGPTHRRQVIRSAMTVPNALLRGCGLCRPAVEWINQRGSRRVAAVQYCNQTSLEKTSTPGCEHLRDRYRYLREPDTCRLDSEIVFVFLVLQGTWMRLRAAGVGALKTCSEVPLRLRPRPNDLGTSPEKHGPRVDDADSTRSRRLPARIAFRAAFSIRRSDQIAGPITVDGI